MPCRVALCLSRAASVDPKYADTHRSEQEVSELEAALKNLGFLPQICCWDDPAVEWGDFQLCVLCPTWDDDRRGPSLLQWVTRVAEAGVRIFNPPSLLQWNSHKAYLTDLSLEGVNVIPTTVTRQREDNDLELLLTTHTAFANKNPQDNTIIVKPAVSSGAVGMERFFVGNADVASCRDAQRYHDELLLSGDVLVQPYLRGVEEWGVLSVVCFDRKFSHAVLRKPAAQEYRVGARHGGSATLVEPADVGDNIMAAVTAVLASKVMQAQPVAYCRLDFVAAPPHEQAVLLEVDTVQADLFLSLAPPGAVARFADAIRACLAPRCFLIAHSIAKKHNLGTLVRSATAFNVEQVCVVGNRQLNTFGSHGAEAHVSMKHLKSLSEVRSYLKNEKGCEIIGVEIMDGARPITEHPFKGNTAFIMGNEGSGLSEQQEAICDSFVYIPQYGAGTASLNVTVAASIVLQHFAHWAGYQENKREGVKYVVNQRPMRTGPRDQCPRDPEEVVEERKQQREGGAMREEWIENSGVDLFD